MWKTRLQLFRDDGTLLLDLIGTPRLRWIAQPNFEFVDPKEQEMIQSIEVVINETDENK